MASKNLLISNGSLAVNIDRNGSVCELYFPYVGMNNALSRKALAHKIGLYTNGAIHWLDDGTWTIKASYYPGRLIGHIIADNPWLEFRIEIQDFVDYSQNVLVRNFHIINTSKRDRKVKLYLHQAFALSQYGNDIVEYVPSGFVPQLKSPAICHYGELGAYVVSAYRYGHLADGWSGFTVGRFGKDERGVYLAGSWCDAADGDLSSNAIEHGLTDSVLQFDLEIKPFASARVCYNLAAGDNYGAAIHELAKFMHDDVAGHLRNTNDHWAEWIRPAAKALANYKEKSSYPIDTMTYINALVELKAATDTHGAIVSDLIEYNCANNDPTKPLPRKINDAQGVQVLACAYAAPCYVYLGYSKEATDLYQFLITARSSSLYLNSAYQANASPINNRHALIYAGKLVNPMELDVAAMLILGFNLAMRQALHADGKLATWKALYKKLIVPLADTLADLVDHEAKRVKPSYRSIGRANDCSASAEVDAIVQRALYALADLAEEIAKDDAGAIRYRMAADDIMTNSEVDQTGRSSFTRALERLQSQLGHSPIATLSNFLGIKVEEIDEIRS